MIVRRIKVLCVIMKKVEYVVVVFFLSILYISSAEMILSYNGFRLFWACKLILLFWRNVCFVCFVFEHLQKTAGELCMSYLHQNQHERLMEISGWELINTVLVLMDIVLNLIFNKFLRNEKYSWNFPLFNLLRAFNGNC